VNDAMVRKLREMVTAAWTSQALYVAAKLGIADLLAAGPRSADELAAATKCHPGALYRLLRALASVGVFTEVEPRRFGMTPLAEGLQTEVSGSARHLAIWYGEDVFRAWADALHSFRTGEPAFDHVFGMSMWEHFARNPESSEHFNIGMGARRWQDQRPLVDSFDFGKIKRLVDVGGGQGSMLAAILNAHHAMEGVLVDLPSALEGAPALLAEAGVSDRCTIVAGSGLDPLPQGGDAYMFSSVLHALDDAQAHATLTRVREAIAPSGRVLIVERVLAPGDQPHFGKLVDLVMLLMNGGRERTEREFGELLAGSGFRLERTVPLPFFIAGIDLSIVEGVAVP
jgi:hypothetical protein